MAYCLEVVSSALFVSNMGADASVTSCTCQILTFSEGNMLAIGVSIALGKTEINYEDAVFIALLASNQEIIWFDVSMDDPLLMDFLNTLDLLYY